MGGGGEGVAHYALFWFFSLLLVEKMWVWLVYGVGSLPGWKAEPGALEIAGWNTRDTRTNAQVGARSKPGALLSHCGLLTMLCI